uniref:DH domain-containing protein n=1 Tax=Macrostomum lignano TaxID=282301 RepID=A0A1I8FLL7_9PLAT
MFPPNSDSWRGCHHRADRFVRPRFCGDPCWERGRQLQLSRASTAASACPSGASTPTGARRRRDCQPGVQLRAGRRLGLAAAGQSSSLENLAFGRDSRGSKEDKADAFLRNLRAAHLFQSSQAATSQDNRDKLHDYLSQCDECGLPRHNNELLSEISADLAPGPGPSPPRQVQRQPAAGRGHGPPIPGCRRCVQLPLRPVDEAPPAGRLELAATSRVPSRPRDFAEGFIRFGEIFEPALAFCLRITESKDYLRQLEKNEAFNDFVKWAQKSSAKNYNSNDCSMDLQLKSLLTMPFQRLTKYGLLLQEIQRHTEDGEDREALELMNRSVSKFCNAKMNSLYRTRRTEEERPRHRRTGFEEAKTNEQLGRAREGVLAAS